MISLDRSDTIKTIFAVPDIYYVAIAKPWGHLQI